MILQTADFNLGEYAGIGLDTRQIYFLAGVLFFGLLSLIAMRRASQAGGLWAAVWGSVAVALIAWGIHIASWGLAGFLPSWLIPFTERETLQRTALLGVMACWSFVFFSAHWVNDSLGKWVCRVLGLITLGSGIWLGIGWFRESLPEEARPYATPDTIVQACVAVALVLLAVGLWVRGRHSSNHRRWLYRSFVPFVLGGLALLALDRFGNQLPAEWQSIQFRYLIIQTIRVWTVAFFAICVVAWWVRDRPVAETPVKPKPAKLVPIESPKQVTPGTLPVAILLDDQGRPVLPPGRRI